MTSLLGPNGQPISDYLVGKQDFHNKKAAPPKFGESYGQWAGRDMEFFQLPGGGVVQFDLSKLTLADYRAMRDHYQINASLSVLSFMQHQSDWHVECENKDQEAFYNEQLSLVWTQLNRAMSQAAWAGFAPSVVQYENDVQGRRVVFDKIKDLAPEECEVRWKEVDMWAPPGYTPPKAKVFDGIKQYGSTWPVDVMNSLWYPMLMENGNYYGRKLLRPAFQSWFFSLLLHLFANRYYERFGEPLPVGRAPFDDNVEVNGQSVNGRDYMGQVINQIRSRSVLVMPNDKSPVGNGDKVDYDYSLEYLESQMRGADFERYMTRLDEEMSIGLFTPILLLRTADVGSYNLGQGHERIYQMMVNSLNADRKQYIDNYVLKRLRDFNFGPNAPMPRIVFRKMGNVDATMLKEVMVALIQNGAASVDLDEFGQAVGMTMHEIKQTLAPPAAPGPAPADPPAAPPAPGRASSSARSAGESAAVATEIAARVRPQVENAMKANKWPDVISMGYKNKLERAFMTDGVGSPIESTATVYRRLDGWLSDVTSSMTPQEFGTTDDVMNSFTKLLDAEIQNASR